MIIIKDLTTSQISKTEIDLEKGEYEIMVGGVDLEHHNEKLSLKLRGVESLLEIRDNQIKMQEVSLLAQTKRADFLKLTCKNFELQIEELKSTMNKAAKGFLAYKQQIKELEEAIENALRIKNLWILGDSVPKEHIGEAKALLEMESQFKQVLKK